MLALDLEDGPLGRVGVRADLRPQLRDRGDLHIRLDHLSDRGRNLLRLPQRLEESRGEFRERARARW